MHVTKPLSGFYFILLGRDQRRNHPEFGGREGRGLPKLAELRAHFERAILNSKQSPELETAIQPEDEEGLFVP